MVCHFFTIMFLARLLDKEAMGLYFIVLMVTFLLKLLSDLGVDLAFVKQYPEETKQGQSSLLRSALAIRFISCSAISVLYIAIEASGAIPFINLIADYTLLTLALYWMHSFREILLRLLQAEQKFGIYAGTQVLAALLKAVMVITLYLLNLVEVQGVLLVEISAFLASILYVCVRLKDTLLATITARFGGGRQVLKFGYPLYLNALLNLGNERVSQYIVAGFGGPLAMAYFGMAERLADAGTRLFEAFANVYYPTQTKHFAADNTGDAQGLADRSMLWIAFIVTSGIVAFTILREPIVLLLFSEKYLSVANAAAMFFGVLLFRSLQTLMGYFGVAAGEKFLPVKVSLVSSVVNIFLCYLLFTRYGYQGAIAALVITQLLMNSLYFIWLKKVGYILSITPVIIISAACTAAIVGVYMLSDHLLISTLLFPVFIIACMALLPQLRSDSAFAWKKLTDTISNHSQSKNTKSA